MILKIFFNQNNSVVLSHGDWHKLRDLEAVGVISAGVTHSVITALSFFLS